MAMAKRKRLPQLSDVDLCSADENLLPSMGQGHTKAAQRGRHEHSILRAGRVTLLQNRPMRKTLLLLVKIFFSVGLLYVALRGIDFTQVKSRLSQINLGWIAVSFAIAAFTDFVDGRPLSVNAISRAARARQGVRDSD